MADSENTRTLPTRRRFLMTAAAATLAPAAGLAAIPLDADVTGSLVANDDAELLALERHWLSLQPEIRALDDRWSEALHGAIERMEARSIDANLGMFTGFIRDLGYGEQDEARSSLLQDDEGRTERRIMETPAAGFVGLAVKLRMLARNMRQGTDGPILDLPEDDLDWENLLAVRALRDAERLAGEVRA